MRRLCIDVAGEGMNGKLGSRKNNGLEKES
jgi:hypothetical protein